MTLRPRISMNPANWAMQQGLLGANQKTLSPSLSAMGENRYLTRDDFVKMIAIALLLHAVVLGIASLFRDREVTDIPVRALSFKIGDGDRTMVSAPMRVAAPVPMPAATPVQHIQAAAPPSIWQKNTPAPRIAPMRPATTHIDTPAPVQPFIPSLERQHPPENPNPLAPLPSSQAVLPQVPPAPASPPLSALPDPNLLSQPAVAANPQRFVREASATPAGNATAEQSAETARVRYEQEISSWVARHYPADMHGLQGRTVVRVRVDRVGNVRYYGVEESSGNAAADAAAIDMIRRANPVPAVPADYPAGALIDFIIPISFKATP